MNFLQFNRNIKIRFFLQFFTTIATMAVTPYLVIYFENRLGTVTTGLMFLGIIFSTMVGSIIGGYYSDRLGRKYIILFSEVFIFIGYLAVAMANSPWANNPYITFILLLMIYFFSGMVNPAYQALIIDVSNPNNRKEIYTFSYWLNNLGIAIGGIIGAFLFKEYLFVLLLGVSLINLFSFLITLFFISETYIPTTVAKPIKSSVQMSKSSLNRSIKPIVQNFIKVLRNKKFTALAIANILILSLELQLTNYIGIRLDSLILDEPLLPKLNFKVDGIEMIGILRTENTLLVVVLSIFVSLMLKKFKDKYVLIFGLILYTIGFAVISYSSTPWILLIAMFFATIGELIHIPVKQTFVANMVPDDERSSYMAVYGLTSLFASIIAGVFIIIGVFMEPLLVTSIFLLMGLTSIIIFERLLTEKTKSADNAIAASSSNEVR